MAQVVAGIRSQIVEEDARRAQFRDEAARVRVQLAECQVALDRLQELRAGLSADRLAQAAQRLDSVEENALAVQIAELEPRQIALGNVNFAALEEFDDARRRLDSLEAQRTDLERSVSELRQAVSQLNQRASSQFREAFEAIRAQFRSLFAQVLAGGDADLGLFGSGIDAGVEIHAQPPGKKVRALDLLSGGEKALVTILLLVSMHRIRPSSLCILDEVDAALDDLNNQRFADLLAVLTKDSQVLVVTHSKQTIEACPTLYGVTMDEPGVSRLVSVRFDGPGKSHQS
jgi:chromosome segregation protein